MCHTWPEGSGRPYRSQVVMRFYRLGDECISYPYGLCKSDVAAAKLFRYQYQCEKSCMHWGNGTVAESGPLPPPISFIAEVASIRVEPRDDLFSPNGSAGQSGKAWDLEKKDMEVIRFLQDRKMRVWSKWVYAHFRKLANTRCVSENAIWITNARVI